MAYATLGAIKFEGLLSPESLRSSQSEKYAVIALAGGKPRLQRIGSELDEVSFSIRLNRQFCDPIEQLEALRSYRQNGEILPLATGGGELLGNFVITQVSTQRTQLDHLGGLVEAMVDVTLMEYYDPNEQGTDEAAAQAKAFANDRRKVVPVVPFLSPPQPGAVVSQNARASVSLNTSAATLTKSAASGTPDALSKLRRAKEQIEAARDKVQAVINDLQSNIALAAKAPEMLAAAQGALVAIPAILDAIAAGNAGAAFAGTTDLGALLSKMVRTAINIETDLLKRAA